MQRPTIAVSALLLSLAFPESAAGIRVFLDGAEALDDLMRKLLGVEIDSGWTRFPTNIL